jgi:hypothetical protein
MSLPPTANGWPESAALKSRFLDQVREACRIRHRRTSVTADEHDVSSKGCSLGGVS